MSTKTANFIKRGQLKIQEMAFVMVGIVLFFALAAVVVVAFIFSNINDSAQDAKDILANELLTTLSSSAEFAFSASDCEYCIDKDKLFILKADSRYASFWGVDYLRIETLYPERAGECKLDNYPNCSTITLVNKSSNFGVPSYAFVPLCYYANGEVQCDIARVFASFRRNG